MKLTSMHTLDIDELVDERNPVHVCKKTISCQNGTVEIVKIC
jgi:hypothetical protein